MRLRAFALLGVLWCAPPALADEVFGGAVHPAEVPDAGHTPVLTKPPQLLQSAEPVYPEEAKAEKLTGDVVMQVDIGADGKVGDVQVLQSAGHGFDEAAVAAVKQFVFSPAEIDNQPAPVRIQYTLHFVYQEPPPPEDAGPTEVDGGAPPPAPQYPIAIRGHILERASRKPIAGAAVKAETASEPSITGPDGYFELRLPPGGVAITVLDPTHQVYQTHELIKTGELLEVTYYLMPKAYGLYETVVRSERDKKEVSRITLTREELEKVPGSFGDPLRVLSDLPGMARAPFGLGLLIVRGASPADTGVYIDGVEIPLLYHFGAGPSVLNPEFIDRLDFYPGGFGAEYGRAIGGIVDVKTRAPKPNQWSGSAHIDLIDTGVFLSAPVIEGLTVSVAARRSYVDAVFRVVLPLVSSSGVLVAPSSYDYQARIDYTPPTLSHNHFSLFFMGSDDLLNVDTGSATATNFQVNMHTGFKRLMGSWVYKTDRLILTSSPYIGDDQQSIGVGLLAVDSPRNVAGLREKLELLIAPYLTLRLGIDSQLSGNTTTARIPLARNDYRRLPGEQGDPTPVSISEERDVYDWGEWAEGEITLPFGMKIFPSLRADQFKVGTHWYPELDPRIIFRQPLGAKEHQTALKASIGMYHELAPAADLDPTTGNPSLPLQAALQTSLGVEQKITDTINIDVTGFYNWRYNLAESSSVVITEPNGTIQRQNYAPTGKGRAYGVEVMLRHEITTNFFGWLAYTLSWSEDDPRPGAGFSPTSFDQRHNLILVAQYKFGNGWELGGRFQLTSGDPTTPVIDSTLSTDTMSYSSINGQANSARLPTFNQLDLRVDKTWLFDRWQLGVYLDVLNVYNAQNAEFLNYDYRYRTQQVITGIPILPTLGVKGSF